MSIVKKIVPELTEGQELPFNYSGESIHAYDSFLTTWQNFAQEGKDAALNAEYSNVEQFAVNALSRLVESNNSSHYTTSPLFDSLHNSAVICDTRGLIIEANKQAVEDHNLAIGVGIDSLDMRVEKSISLSDKIRELAHTPIESRLSLLQCHSKDSPVVFPIAIIQLEEKEYTEPAVLIIFMDAACNAETLELFSLKFGLTPAETSVVTAFAQGISLKEIAKSRFRSYTTIRNQFQSILEKTGCPNQADLLRVLLGVSYLLSFTELISPIEEKEIGKKVQVMRPNGRFVDVRLYGKLDGEPFIILPSIFGMPITAGIEESLKEQSLLMIGVWRPGFSETSKAHKGDQQYQCLADDISAVLDSIGVKQCPLIGRASAARSIFNLAQIIPNRISAACIVNSLVPLPYVIQNKILSRWTVALVSAIQYSPLLATLILETGRRLMMGKGVKSFIQKMYKDSPSDLETLNQEGVSASLYQGVLSCSLQGFEAPAQDMIDGFQDWSDDVKQAKIKVTLLQGRNDPNISIKASHDFAADFPDKVELIEYKEGGGLLNYTHSKEIFEWVVKHSGRISEHREK